VSSDHAIAVETVVADALSRLAAHDGALLPILHAINDRLGWIPPDVVPRLAHALNLSRAEVEGTLSFYPDFRRTPPARHVLRLCRAEACQAMGARALEEHVKAKLGCGFHQSGRDVTLEPVYCLGNCACAPALTIDGTLHGRVTVERFDELADQELSR
jgi:formate dehydrogenase subunit gamma